MYSTNSGNLSHSKISKRGFTMKKKKSIASRIVAVSLAAMTLFSLGAIGTSAANTHDTTFDFRFARHMDKTDGRLKENNSKVYMYCYEATHPYTARVYGGDINTCFFDMSDGHVYTFTSGTVRRMTNYVYENGAPYAVVIGEPTYWDSGAWGYWSLDSRPV